MSGFEPYALAVDGQREPGGVVSPPRFSWRLRSDAPGARQRAYRIQVRQCFPNGQSVQVWDSGRVESGETVAIGYRGAALVTSTRYEWSLTVEDADGATATAEAGFGTGVVHPDDWQAVWIARDPDVPRTATPPQDTDISYTVNKLQPVRRLVRTLELDEKPARAAVHASAHGIYRLYVNGHRVGTDELAPGWTEYRDRVTYQSWDVTDLLVAGTNSIAALLGDGWYVGFIGTDRRHQAQHYGKQTALLAQLVIDRADGGREVVATGNDWRATDSEILYADLLMGQYEDSRLAEPQWLLPGFDTSGWPRAVTVDTDTSRLVPEIDPGVRAAMDLAPVEILGKGEGRHIVDFGQNLVGHVRIRLRGLAAGDRVQLNHAEVLDDGELYTANLRTAEPVDVFWANGEAEQVFEPRFTLHGFRFLEVQGVPDLRPDDLVAVVVHNGFDLVSDFSSSDPTIDRLFANVQWSLRGNFVSIPTDCPQRDERLGWLADAQVFAPTALAMAEVGPLLSRWLRDVRSAQRRNGAFPDIAPHLIHLREGAPAWGDGGVTIPWEVYRATGDRTVLAEAADSMVAWVRHIERHNPDLLWRNAVGNNYGDWLQLGEETPKDVLATAYFAHSCDLTARSLRILGRHLEADRIAALAARVAAAFRDAFVAEDGTVTGDTQGCYLLALAFGLCPDPELRAKLADRLVAAVERRGVSLTTGFVTVGLLCPVLAAIGREDLAFALLHNDRNPSWLFSVRNGATTIWERWDGWTPEAGFQSARMNSFNHYSLGSVGQWYISGILGISQAEDSAGYRRLELAPLFDPQLDHAEGHLETPRGRVVSSWRRGPEGIDWHLSVPPGDLASVTIRRAHGITEKEGGELATLPGVTTNGDIDGLIRFTVAPGNYDFRIHPE